MATPPPGRPLSPAAGRVTGERFPAVDLLPELWSLILGRLPIKFLLISRCVSKTWRSIIDNPNFIQLHSDLRKSSIANNFLLTWEPCMSDWKPNKAHKILLRDPDDFTALGEILRIDPSPIDFYYLGYAQGLMLFRGRKYSSRSVGLVLFNPCIRKFLLLPPSPPVDPTSVTFDFLVFDPRSNDHKVIQLQKLQGGFVGFVASYSVETGRWEGSIRPGSEAGRSWLYPVAAKGLIHWKMYYDWELASLDYAYDGDGDGFSFTKLPGDPCEVVIAFTLRDSFAIFTVSSTRACVWVLYKCGGDDVDSWIKFYDGPLDSDAYELLREYEQFDIFYLEEIEKLLFIMVAEVKYYDLKTHMMEDLEPPRSIDHDLQLGGRFRESLLLSEGVGLDSLELHPDPDTESYMWCKCKQCYHECSYCEMGSPYS